MYAYIKGELTQSNAGQIVVETNGVGYSIAIPTSVFARLPAPPCTVQIYTSFVVRENSQALYGFLHENERDCFETLLGVSGIGPKLALSIIGHLALQDLHTAIASQDIPSLIKIPGIGRKTAERLLIEMRDKLPQFVASDLPASAILASDPRSQVIRDAMSALINLGYNQVAAQKAIKASLKELGDSEEVDLASLITCALKCV